MFLKTQSQLLVPQSCPAICNPMHCSPPGSSVHGILQARILGWVAISFSMGIFLTWESKLGLQHYTQILYHLNHQLRVKQTSETEQLFKNIFIFYFFFLQNSFFIIIVVAAAVILNMKLHAPNIFLFKKIILFIYFWLHQVFITVQAFSSCSKWRSLSCCAWTSHCGSFSCFWTQALACLGFSSCGAWAWSTACGIFPDQGSNLHPLYQQMDSLPLSHQRSPQTYFLCPFISKGNPP